jgi:hypothetical protein
MSDSHAEYIYTAWTHLFVNVEGNKWFMITENNPQNEKLTLFLDFYVEQLMASHNIPIEMWNLNNHRHRTNNAVEGWHSKLKKTL